MIKKLTLIIIILSLLSSGCTQLKEKPMPDIGIQTEDINSTIELEVPPGLNTYKIGESIEIVIKIVGNDRVWFSRDTGARIFSYEDGEWKELANLTDYSRISDYILIPYDNNPLNRSVTGVRPELTDVSKPITIRIFVIGKIVEGKTITDKQVGAYIDVRLKP